MDQERGIDIATFDPEHVVAKKGDGDTLCLGYCTPVGVRALCLQTSKLLLFRVADPQTLHNVDKITK
jgi:hypothetical protein